MGNSDTEDRATAVLKAFLNFTKWIIKIFKAALMHVRHVQKSVTLVQTIARDIREWNNAANCAGFVLLPAANVLKNVEMVILLQHNNVQMPVGPVQTNVKSMMMNIVNIVLKNAENATKNVGRLQLKAIIQKQAIREIIPIACY